MAVANLLHLCADSHTRALAAVAACNARTMIDDACWDMAPPLDDTPRPLVPRSFTAHCEREPGRLQLRLVLARTSTSTTSSWRRTRAASSRSRRCAVRRSAATPERLLEVDVERALHLLGERTVIDALSGRPLPYRNVLAELAEEYGLNGNGAGDEQAVD